MCNYIVSCLCVTGKGKTNGRQGNERWLEQLESQFQSEFLSSKPTPWVTMETGRLAGEVRSAGGDGFSAGNVTFVNVHEAG